MRLHRRQPAWALEAGAEFKVGHEARAEFGESLAPETADQQNARLQHPVHLARLRQTDALHAAEMGAQNYEKESEITRHHSWEYGYWWIEWGGHLNTIRDNERIRFELLGIVMGVWDYIKNSGKYPASANWAMDWVGMLPGKREARRLVGDHMLTQMDLMGLNPEFDDAVCIGGWNLDEHPPTGLKTRNCRHSFRSNSRTCTTFRCVRFTAKTFATSLWPDATSARRTQHFRQPA